MREKGKMKIITSLLISLAIIIGQNNISHAKVVGECANCHTMHNSQDGNYLQITPQNSLLTKNCVGCHSSTDSTTIVHLGASKIPIVWNIGGSYPSQPLAGGNFNSVGQGSANDSHGHNVWGISAEDATLTKAPGGVHCSGFSTGVCHQSLAFPPQDAIGGTGKTGCQGCHTVVSHHSDTPAYRFLQGHEGPENYVTGIESDDWEQIPTSASHNIYQGAIDPPDPSLGTTHSISSFCAGCHTIFHENGGTGGSSPWIRHPTDIALPEGNTEYNDYNPVTGYDPKVPVGWLNPAVPKRAEAVVMCLSCHRAHGSQYPDMLRWDFSNDCDAATANANCGCFVCHTTKDEY